MRFQSSAFEEGWKGRSPEKSGQEDFHTPRQKEVLQLLAEGFSVKEIASNLDTSPRTVEYHKYRMVKELGLKSAAALIRYAVKRGITGTG